MSARSRIRTLLGLPANQPQVATTQEAAGGFGIASPGPGIDKDEYQYRQLGGNYSGTGKRVRDQTLKRAIEHSRYLYDTNPFAHGILETVKDFVVGEGFTPKVEPRDKETGLELDVDDEASQNARDDARDQAQGIILRHWEDPQNNWVLKQHQRIRELGMDGEQIYPVFVNKANGHVRLGLIDPLTVRAVYWNEENMEECIAVEVAGKSDRDSFFYRVIHRDEDPDSSTFGRLIGAAPDETFTKKFGNNRKRVYSYTGSCFYFYVNKHSSEPRGRPDLLSIIDWLAVYDRIAFQFADRMDIMSSFIWDVQLNNADQRKIQEWVAQHAKPPRPGTVRAHNEGEIWSAVNPDLRMEDNAFGAQLIKAHALSATGLPPFWFAEGGETTRATALEMGTPALKRLSARQLEAQHMIEYILQFVLDQAMIHEPSQLNEKYSYKVVVEAPEMSSRDLTRTGAAMLSVASSLELALTNRFVDQTAAQEIFSNISAQLGVEINLEAMQKRIEAMPEPQDDPLHPNYQDPEQLELQKQGLKAKMAGGNPSSPSFRKAPKKGGDKRADPDHDSGMNKGVT